MLCFSMAGFGCGHLGGYIALAGWDGLQAMPAASALILLSIYSAPVSWLPLHPRKSRYATTPFSGGLNLLRLVEESFLSSLSLLLALPLDESDTGHL